MESFEALHAVRRGTVKLRALVPGYRPTQASEHAKVRTVITALGVLDAQLQKAAWGRYRIFMRGHHTGKLLIWNMTRGDRER